MLTVDTTYLSNDLEKDKEIRQKFDLISFVESRPCLWDKGHPRYMDCGDKNRAWDEIAFEMSRTSQPLTCDAMKMKKLWKSLCDGHRRVLRGPSTGSGPSRMDRWIFFDRLFFLRKSEVHGVRFSSVSDDSALDSISTSTDIYPDYMDNTEYIVEDIIGESDYQNVMPNLKREVVSPSNSSGTEITTVQRNVLAAEKPKKRKRGTDDDVFIQSALDTMKQISSGLQNTNEDENDSLGAHLADVLRSLKPKKARQLKKQVYGLIATFVSEVSSDDE